MATATPPYALPIAEEVLEGPVLDHVPVIVPVEHRPKGVLGWLRSAVEWCFGFAFLMVVLAVLSAIPVLQFLTLGYLLEASGRVARGRLRDGFIGIPPAARLAGLALGVFVFWLPLYLLSYMADRARIIDPDGQIARRWDTWLVALTTLFALHVTAACLRSGRLRGFLWPFNVFWLVGQMFRTNILRDMRDGLWNTFRKFRLPYYFWLGVRGFLGAFIWLLIPLVLLGQGHRALALGILGAITLGVVVLYLPFLQTRFARDNRFRAFFQLQKVRRDYRYAPFSFAFALTVHLLLAVPLYVWKIELIPWDLMYLEGLVFLAFMYPAHLLDGWAYARSTSRRKPAFWLWRWAGRVSVVPVVVAYVLTVFLSQHVGWNGVGSLFEQHAFLVPAPFTK
jgi:hypothetical protein